MNITQKVYNWLKNLSFPKWLKPYIQELNDIMIVILKKAGQDYIQYLTAEIISAAKDNSLNSSQKFEYVFKQAKKSFPEFMIKIKDNELNTMINYLVSKLKSQGAI